MAKSKKPAKTPPPTVIGEEQIARILGEELFGLRFQTVRNLILARGGSGANVNHAGIWADQTLDLAAESAFRNIPEALKAVKMVKQARRLGEKY